MIPVGPIIEQSPHDCRSTLQIFDRFKQRHDVDTILKTVLTGLPKDVPGICIV